MWHGLHDNWREAMASVQQEVLLKGKADLGTLQPAINALSAAVATSSSTPEAAAAPPGVVNGIVVIAQQLTQLYCCTSITGQASSCNSNSNSNSGFFAVPQDARAATATGSGKSGTADISQRIQPKGQLEQQQQQQQEQQQVFLQTCCTFCNVVRSTLSCLSEQQQQQQQPPVHRRRHPRQQQAAQALLPSPAATAICCCLRHCADQQLALNCSSSCTVAATCWQLQVQQAATAAFAVLLPQQLPALAAHERAGALALLCSLAQPRYSGERGGGCVGSSALQHDACMQVAMEVQLLSVQILGQLCKKANGCSLTNDEVSGVTSVLLDVLTSSCSSISSSSSSSSHDGCSGQRRPIEDAEHAQFYAALLSAINYAITVGKQGWQCSAGAITESARRLLTYGVQQSLCSDDAGQQQQQQQQQHQQQQQQQQQPHDVDGTAGSDYAAPAAAIGALVTEVDADSAAAVAAAAAITAKARYQPPHLRKASAAAAATASEVTAALPQQEQQWWSDTESTSEWSDASDSEQILNRRSSRTNSCFSSSSSSSRQRRNQQQQPQQVLHDPIKSYRVRIAVLQLLQCLVQADVRALHPYLSALLPSQQPLQQRPLSPHLVTVLLHDPCHKAQLLAAAVIGALLEGPAARALLAVAEARSAKPSMRGFTTLSTSLGHMLLALHTGLLAAVTATAQQHQQQAPAQLQVQHGSPHQQWCKGQHGPLQQHQQQRGERQEQLVEAPPCHLLSSVLRVLCTLVQVTPYDRLPAELLTQVVAATWSLCQQLHEEAAAGDANSSTTSSSATLQTLCHEDWTSTGGSYNAAVAVLAQALSTKKASAGLSLWLKSNTAAVAAAETAVGYTTTKQPAATLPAGRQGQQQCLVLWLLSAAMCSLPLLRIEALAALRGCCINYPAALPAPAPTAAATGREGRSSWPAVLAAVQHSLAATQVQVLRSPRGSLLTASAAGAAAFPGTAGAMSAASSTSGSDASASTSPDDKAAQHAVKLLGDWLAAVLKLQAAWLSNIRTPGAADAEAAAEGAAAVAGVEGTGIGNVLVGMWVEALQLLAHQQVSHHPCCMIRSAAAAVVAEIPAAVWQQLPSHLQQQLLTEAATTAKCDAAPAARAAACKELGSLLLLPGVLLQQQQQGGQEHGEQQQGGQQHDGQQYDRQQQWLLHCVLQPLASCMQDSAVSVRLNASWAVANLCDMLRPRPGTNSTDDAACEASNSSGERSNLQLAPAIVRLLCESALTAAGDSEKVRANGIRAVGALLEAWLPGWGLGSSSSSRGSASGSSMEDVAFTDTAQDVQPAAWCWVPGWLHSAAALLQSCLASRSFKVVWNAAYAAAGLLRNTHLHQSAEVRSCIPSLLLVLVVLVRDSPNYKIKTHAAAALGAVGSRDVYGDCFCDAMLVLAATLEAISAGSSSGSDGSSSSCSNPTAAPAAARRNMDADAATCDTSAVAIEEDGNFPNFRYMPGLLSQLQTSLLRILGLVAPHDAARLHEPMQRRKQQLLQLIQQRAACTSTAQSSQQQQEKAYVARVAAQQVNISGSAVLAAEMEKLQTSAAAGHLHHQQQQLLPCDPFSQGHIPHNSQQKPQHQLGPPTPSGNQHKGSSTFGHRLRPVVGGGVCTGSSCSSTAMLVHCEQQDIETSIGTGPSSSSAAAAVRGLSLVLGDPQLLRQVANR